MRYAFEYKLYSAICVYLYVIKYITMSSICCAVAYAHNLTVLIEVEKTNVNFFLMHILHALKL